MKSNGGQQLEAAQHEGVKICICPIILLEDFFLNQRQMFSIRKALISSAARH